MPVVAHRNGAKLVIVNRDETACDDIADIMIRDQAGSVMSSVLEGVRKALS
jgi:NAD-dependent SIR2 family protein deacetylase